MPSFCAASAANSSRAMRLGMRRMWGSRKLSALILASGVARRKELAGAVDEVVLMTAARREERRRTPWRRARECSGRDRGRLRARRP